MGHLTKFFKPHTIRSYTHLGVSGSLLGLEASSDIVHITTIPVAINTKCLKTWHAGGENAAQEERGGVTAKEQRGRC